MTDNEIIKALECCLPQNGKRNCDDCPYAECEKGCADKLTKDSLNLINHQKAEIAELKSEISILTDANENLQDLYREEQAKVETAKQKVIDAFKKLNTAKSEAIREFAERLKDMHKHNTTSVVSLVTVFDNIDDLVKEMTEGTNV